MDDDQKSKPTSVRILTPAAWREGKHPGGKREPVVGVGLTTEEWEFMNALDVVDPVEHCLKHAVAEYIKQGNSDPPHFDQGCTSINLNFPVIPELWCWLQVRGGTVVDHLTAAILEYLRKKGFKGERLCSAK